VRRCQGDDALSCQGGEAWKGAAGAETCMVGARGPGGQSKGEGNMHGGACQGGRTKEKATCMVGHARGPVQRRRRHAWWGMPGGQSKGEGDGKGEGEEVR
jgi:hypothetical protein